MRNLNIFIGIICLFFSTRVYAQKGQYVEKDYRILKYEKGIVQLLIKEKQITETGSPFKIEDYEQKLFVKKCLEIYLGNSSDILLVRFGSLSDHNDKYWGVLSSQKAFLFYGTNDKDFLALKKVGAPRTVALISFYIKQITNEEKL